MNDHLKVAEDPKNDLNNDPKPINDPTFPEKHPQLDNYLT